MIRFRTYDPQSRQIRPTDFDWYEINKTRVSNRRYLALNAEHKYGFSRANANTPKYAIDRECSIYEVTESRSKLLMRANSNKALFGFYRLGYRGPDEIL